VIYSLGTSPEKRRIAALTLALAAARAELLAIHTIGMCIAECQPATPEDTVTVRMVKDMAHRLNAYGRQGAIHVYRPAEGVG
jgi:hypothetical protein